MHFAGIKFQAQTGWASHMYRIMVVDDEPNLRTAIRLMLEPMDHEILEASDGQEALKLLGESPIPHLVICDLFMPNMDGLELIRHLSKKFPKLKILAMSGGGFGGRCDLLSVASDFGAVALLNKPFESTELVNLVRQILPPLGLQPSPA